MTRWVLLLLVLASDPAAPSEEAGAKAMFGDRSLNVIHISPREREAKPPRNDLPAEAPEKVTRARSPLPQPVTRRVHGGPPPVPATAEPVRSIGVRFWIQEVDDHGKVVAEVEVGRVFRSGDRIQLVVESNTEGYLAVVQHGADGRAGLLFPARESDLGADRIRAGVKVVLPDPRHSFTFDQEAGTERLLIVLVRDRQELAELPLRSEMGPADLAAVRRLGELELGAKNLVTQAFAEDDPATYAVNRAGGAIVQEIALVHER